jgi:hypothetical protein
VLPVGCWQVVGCRCLCTSGKNKVVCDPCDFLHQSCNPHHEGEQDTHCNIKQIGSRVMSRKRKSYDAALEDLEVGGAKRSRLEYEEDEGMVGTPTTSFGNATAQRQAEVKNETKSQLHGFFQKQQHQYQQQKQQQSQVQARATSTVKQPQSQLQGFFQRKVSPSSGTMGGQGAAAAKDETKASGKCKGKDCKDSLPQYCIVHRDCARSGFESAQGYRILVIPRNILLFRGRGPNDPVYIFPDKPRPTYFSDALVATAYADNVDSQCGVFTFARDARLIDLSDVETVRRLHKNLTGTAKQLLEIMTGYARTRLAFQGSDAEVFSIPASCSYAKKPPGEVRICTEAFLTVEDYLQREYTSLRLARILCELGFDGWVIGPTYKRASGADFHAEVMLCDPSQLVTPHPELHCSQYSKLYNQLANALAMGMITGALDKIGPMTFA